MIACGVSYPSHIHSLCFLVVVVLVNSHSVVLFYHFSCMMSLFVCGVFCEICYPTQKVALTVTSETNLIKLTDNCPK